MLRTLIFFCALLPGLAFSASSVLTQRNAYVAAEKALHHGQMAEFQRLKTRLENEHYILAPYLEYAELQTLFSQGKIPTEQVHAFLTAENDSALGDRLRTSWLHHLAKKSEWALYLEDYRNSKDPALQCDAIYARYKTSNDATVFAEAKPLWLTGKSQPPACDRLFDAWKKQGGLTESLVWDRIYLAMEANQYTVVNFLTRYLPQAKQPLVQAWLSTYRDPKIITSEKIFGANQPFLRETQIYGLKRIARKEPDKAISLWKKLEKKYAFSVAQRMHAQRIIAINLAMDHEPEALDWFKKIPLAYYDNTTYEWHVRAALRHGEWDQVARLIPEFPESLRKDSSWTYWLARAYEHTGKQEEARALYTILSKERSFAGILSSERLGTDYAISLPTIPVTEEDMNQTVQNKGIARALELHEMGRQTLARREWMETISRLSEVQLQAAAIIAFENGWQERALLTLARAENQNNLAIRFPVVYQKTIEKEAKRHGLNPAWIFAIARRESAFVPDVKSPVGATGLMQLMPYTAKQIAKTIKEPYHSPTQLTNTTLNLRLGSAYLNQIYKDLDENMILATAAYNAGPHRVKQWLPKHGKLATDVWIETVPFYETREYVKAVLVYRLIYQHHLKINERLGSTLGEIEA
jgi:soluble lytic murein transglycosylase